MISEIEINTHINHHTVDLNKFLNDTVTKPVKNKHNRLLMTNLDTSKYIFNEARIRKNQF